jgi:hypothetical protein
MAMNRYGFAVTGVKGKDEKPWAVRGEVECEWHQVFLEVMQQVVDASDRADCPFQIRTMLIYYEART